jgi:hypothetical protein
MPKRCLVAPTEKNILKMAHPTVGSVLACRWAAAARAKAAF